MIVLPMMPTPLPIWGPPRPGGPPLADLGAPAAGELLVEDVLVDALALRAAVLLGPGHAEPALVAHLLHEGAPLGRVDDLGHVLAGDVEDVDVVVVVAEGDDLLGERLLLLGELEVHDYPSMNPGSHD